ncbi:MAG: DUF3576 domain-containing protein [Alphaproteobacteria bacterium]|nr:DUF3576 domain-containing protein [Alphaproteobacteria bacterium]
MFKLNSPVNVFLKSSCSALCMLICACSNTEGLKKNTPVDQDYNKKFSFGSLAGEGGLEFGSGSKPNRQPDNTHVSIHLWRASLDALSFAPIQVSDNVGGLITTDWYTTGQENQRFKVNIRITSKDLRADGLSVKLFKQERRAGGWVDIPSQQTRKQVTDLENLILDRAKALYIETKGRTAS